MRLPLAVTVGSSPLARGTLLALELLNDPVRLIPARAGNTRHGGRYPPVRTAHPRSRGEHSRHVTYPAASVGSSPLARGTPALSSIIPVHGRLIPARAGNTPSVTATATSKSAHPRSRGEHPLPGNSSPLMSGSSPLARGTPTWVTCWVCPSRLIPARAGNTSALTSPLDSAPAHPRSRGEHLSILRHSTP